MVHFSWDCTGNRTPRWDSPAFRHPAEGGEYGRIPSRPVLAYPSSPPSSFFFLFPPLLWANKVRKTRNPKSERTLISCPHFCFFVDFRMTGDLGWS